MSQETPRMRMFTGPNGSGKSELKKYLPPALLGVYLNPDEIEKEILQHGFLDLNSYGVKTTADEVLTVFTTCSFLISAGHSNETKRLGFKAVMAKVGKYNQCR